MTIKSSEGKLKNFEMLYKLKSESAVYFVALRTNRRNRALLGLVIRSGKVEKKFAYFNLGSLVPVQELSHESGTENLAYIVGGLFQLANPS